MHNRLAIRYAIEGDLRFISHQDTLRLFKRAVNRATIPVRYTQGFNPHPRITILLPRPVGVASCDERLVLELTADDVPAEILQRLSEQVPTDIQLLSAERVSETDRCLPCRVDYALELEPLLCESVKKAAAEFLRQERVIITRSVRDGKTAPKQVDIRAYMLKMEVTHGVFHWSQSISQEGTARVGEVLECVGLSSGDHLHHVLRESVSLQP